MLLKSLKLAHVVMVLALCVVIQTRFTACYKTEIAITPSTVDEPTTKKSGFFGGIKKLFRSETTTTTVSPNDQQIPDKTIVPLTTNIGTAHNINPSHGGSSLGPQRPPPLNIPKAPLMPIGPRPDTPPSSPVAGRPQEMPQWPQPQSTGATITSTPNSGQVLPHKPNIPLRPNNFGPYQPPRSQPSGIDLSYGGGNVRPVQPTSNGFGGLAPLTTTTITTARPKSPTPNVDLRLSGDAVTTKKPYSSPIKEDFPVLPTAPPSSSAKEAFPALPVPKSPLPTLTSLTKPTLPSAWNQPLPTAASNQVATPFNPKTGPLTNGDRVAFKPHSGPTTTIRPGVAATSTNLATDDEIKALTETLYSKEANSQMNFIRVNAQGKTRSIDSTDEAPQPLLEIDSKALESLTIAKMRLLFNNYEMDTMVNEHVTANERKEENDFLDAVMSTQVMRQAMLFLQNKGLVSPDPKTHRDLVKELWFTQYSRGNGKIGSSGFEHVFVNEVKNGTIIGLHNWVYFYDEEKAGRLNYMGYLNQLDLGTKAKVMKIRFTHNGLNKPVNTLFIGTSPELELALYTVCFQVKPDRTCPVSLGGNHFGIVTYSWRYRGKNLIGSAYPEI